MSDQLLCWKCGESLTDLILPMSESDAALAELEKLFNKD